MFHNLWPSLYNFVILLQNLNFIHKHRLMPYIIAIIVIIALGVGFTLFQSRGEAERSMDQVPAVITAPPASTSESPTAPETPVTQTTTTSDYKDGTYKSDVTYQTPKRDEYGVGVSLTLSKDIVTGVTVTYSQGAEKDPNAQRFEAAYKTEVIGKDIDTLNLARVGGASLTTGAFNNALAEIKSDAKS
jgi:hypothetical protein